MILSFFPKLEELLKRLGLCRARLEHDKSVGYTHIENIWMGGDPESLQKLNAFWLVAFIRVIEKHIVRQALIWH